MTAALPPSSDGYRPGRFDGLLLRLGTAGALVSMLARGGRWWMVPLVVVLVALAGVLIFLQGIHYVAPFIYMVF